MKVRLLCRDENYDKYLEDLKNGNIEISNNADITLIENNYEINSILGKHNEEYELLYPENIIFIESYSNEIICHTVEGTFNIKEKLYEIEGLFSKYGFIRVNISYVVNKQYIKRIKPTYNSKFILTMSNGQKVDVTRTYYNKFKDFIGY